MSYRPKNKLILFLSMMIVSLMAFTVAFTAAAFSGYEQHNQEIDVDLGYGKYFGTGSGVKDQETGVTKYYITSSDQLRNLSYLVNLGVFDEKDEFELTSFTYTGAALTPIGNDQFPFRSYFHGKDLSTIPGKNTPNAPIIKNLVVEGKNIGDVGMFGYIANEGRVENFILDHPVIKSTYYETSPVLVDRLYNWEKVDGNPLRNVINRKGALVFSPSNCSKIKITNLDTDSKTTKIMKKFSINFNEIEKTYSLNDGIDVNAEIEVDISRKDLLTYDEKSNTFNAVTIDKAPTDVNGRLKQGDYLTVTISAKGICQQGDSYRFAKMTLERFKLYYKYDGKGFVADENDMKTYYPTIYPPVYSIKQDVVDEDTGVEGWEIYDDVRALYVGIITGRLDGLIHRIGVLEPILDINRPFISNSLFVGLAIDDDNRRTLSNEEFDYNTAVNTKGGLKFTYIPSHYQDFDRLTTGTPRKVAQADRGFVYNQAAVNRKGLGNRYVDNIYVTEDKTSAPGLMSKSGSNIIRIYGTRLCDKQGHDTTDANGNGENHVFESINNVEGVDKKAISIDAPMDVTLTTAVKSQSTVDVPKNPDDMGYNDALMENCIQFWVSTKRNNSKLSFWNNNSLEFYLHIELDYIYYDDNYNANPTQADDVLNKMYFYAAEKNIHLKKYVRKNTRYTKKMYYSRPRYATYDPIIKSLHPEILADIAHKPLDRNSTVFTNNNTNLTYGCDHYYPFAYLEDYKEGSNVITGDQMLSFTQKETSGNVPTNGAKGSGVKVGKKVFNIVANHDYVPMKAKNKYDIVIDRLSNGFFPVFYLGFPTRNDNVNFRFDILGMNVTISNKRGNIDSSYGTVDYCKEVKVGFDPMLPYSGGRFNSSGVRVSSKTIQNMNVVTTEPAAGTIPHFAATSSEALVNGKDHCRYIIKANRAGDLVTVRFETVGIATALENLKYIMCQNKEGFKEAKIIKETGLMAN